MSTAAAAQHKRQHWASEGPSAVALGVLLRCVLPNRLPLIDAAGNEGALYLAAALICPPNGCRLQQLHITSAGIGPVGARALTAALHCTSSLQKVRPLIFSARSDSYNVYHTGRGRCTYSCSLLCTCNVLQTVRHKLFACILCPYTSTQNCSSSKV